VTLVEELREQGITLEAEGDRLKIRAPVDKLTPELRIQLAEKKGAILVQLRGERVRTLEERVRFAQSEEELDHLVEEIQGRYEVGHLCLEESERLTCLVISTARQLAQGLVNVSVGSYG